MAPSSLHCNKSGSKSTGPFWKILKWLPTSTFCNTSQLDLAQHRPVQQWSCLCQRANNLRQRTKKGCFCNSISVQGHHENQIRMLLHAVLLWRINSIVKQHRLRYEAVKPLSKDRRCFAAFHSGTTNKHVERQWLRVLRNRWCATWLRRLNSRT